MSKSPKITGPTGGERIVNLAFTLLSSIPRSFEEILSDPEVGYPKDSSAEALEKMFTRDKSQLKELGFPLVEQDGRYHIDMHNAFTQEVTLSSHETTWLQIISETIVRDPSFLLTKDLKAALSKIGRASSTHFPVDEGPSSVVDPCIQIALEARHQGTPLTFTYSKTDGSSRKRKAFVDTVFSRGEYHYVVAQDTDTGEARHFRTDRMTEVDLKTSTSAPAYEPRDVDVREITGLPFQYGEHDLTVIYRIPAELAWYAEHFTRSKGEIVEQPCGSLHWKVKAKDVGAAARWAAEKPIGIFPVAPPEVVEAYRKGLEAVTHD